MQLIDTHSHLYSEEFDQDRESAIQRAEESGVIKMILPAIDSETTHRQESLEQQYPTLFRQMMGLHPTSVKDNFESELTHVENQLKLHPNHYVGIGEIGLDLYWDKTYQTQQEEVLKIQLQWAKELHLPVALHIREAYEELFEVLNNLNYPSYNGILHCYSGDLHQAHQAIEMGFLLGIGGVVTYKKSTLPEIVKDIPLERLVLETDCPYLAPVPHRGKRNESSFLTYIAERIASIKECTTDEVADITTYNAQQLFSL